MVEANNNEVEFNDAFTCIKRLDRRQELINESFRNLLLRDEFGTFEYENAFNNIKTIYGEIVADLTPGEIEQAELYVELIQFLFEKFPIFEQSKTVSFDGTNNSVSYDHTNFRKVEQALIKYRNLIAVFKKKHGYSNPTKESSRVAMMR